MLCKAFIYRASILRTSICRVFNAEHCAERCVERYVERRAKRCAEHRAKRRAKRHAERRAEPLYVEPLYADQVYPLCSHLISYPSFLTSSLPREAPERQLEDRCQNQTTIARTRRRLP